MKNRFSHFAVSTFVLFAFCMMVTGGLANAQSIKCEVGPVTKRYGKSDWLVYSCSDGVTAVVISAPGNPAMPFYFMLSPQGRGYRVSGEGTGPKEFTDAAFTELSHLSPVDVSALIKQTQVLQK